MNFGSAMDRGGALDGSCLPRVVVYGAIVGGYDVLVPARVRDPGMAQLLFSDCRPWPAWGWDVRPLPEAARSLPPTLANRWCKLFAHELAPEADVSVYLDGNIRQIGSLRPMIAAFLASGATLGLFRHGKRNDLFVEAEACEAIGKFDDEDRTRLPGQIARYRAGGLDTARATELGLTENGVLVRRHDRAALAPAMALWWQELERGVKRDQICLPWVRHATGIATHVWDWNYRAPNPWFEMTGPHQRAKGPARDLLRALDVARHDGPLREALYHGLALGRRVRRAIKGG